MSRRSLNNYQKRHPLLGKLEHWLHGKTRRLIGNSQAVVDQLRGEPNVEPGRVSLIYNGIDTARYQGPGLRRDLRAGLDIDADALIVLIVANLIPYKGHEDLLHALALARPELPPAWELLVAGRDDGIGGQLQELARDLGISAQVRWLGPREDVVALQRAADIGVLCSHEEGFSNAVLEAMAAGLPMVVTDVGGNAEAVEHGVTGLVVPAAEPVALARAIIGLARAPQLRAQFGRAARERVEAHFSLGRCVDDYVQLYTKVLNDAP